MAGERARAPARTFYRAVATRETSLKDFRSNRELGKPPRGAELNDKRLWEGLSVSTNKRRLADKCRKYGLGEFVAELRIPTDGTIRFEKTLTTSDHYTLWGEPADIQAQVRSVTTVTAIMRR